MQEYATPLRDMLFVLREVAPLDEVNQLPGCADVNLEMAEAILTEAGKFATEVLSPLNVVGDQKGAKCVDGVVTTAPGWRDAYSQFVSGGWNGLGGDAEHGGQGAPRLVSALVEEIWNGANMAFTLCPMLTHGAIEALELCGSPAQKKTYLPKLVSGEWAGTMLLTEPQAGSDLAAVRSRATPRGDGTYGVEGQKIFITYGEHDLTENIIHLVLARTPDAPPGVKGISLFVVPKFLVQADGSVGARNDIRCVSLEHKLGIHASPTAVLAMGDQGGAVGWLVGEENRGIEYMFIMMNAARYAVGLQGIGLSERAYQQALWYARERVQGSELGSKNRQGVPILRHPDVRRMLLLMKSQTEATRALASVTAAAIDTARCHPDAAQRAASQAFVELMIPIVKGWSTEASQEITSLGVQVHGGMGFVEETGAAQLFRDARITTIYEGTTGIQAADLMGRKVARDGGATIRRVMAEMSGVVAELEKAGSADLSSIAATLREAVAALEAAVQFVLTTFGTDVRRAAVGAGPFLMLFGTVAGGWQMARSALAAQRQIALGHGDGFYRAKIATARFYADHVLTRASSLSRATVSGAEGALAIEDDHF
ncbi:MAG: acyl-CoA dehydrogenase C-terminal domain-containing protein [Deltaproteobacteria bacterium]